MANIKGWRMTRHSSGGEVYPGTTQLDRDGREWKVLGVVRPPNPAQPLGYLLAQSADGGKAKLSPEIFGIQVVETELVPEGVEELFASLSESMEDTLNEAAKDVTQEALHQKAEEWGCTPEDVIMTAAIQRVTPCASESIAMAIRMARELGYREGLKAARKGI